MADRTPLTVSEVEHMVGEYPGLPAMYFDYLRDIGWGVSPSGHMMIFSGPISPGEVYGDLFEGSDRVLIGADFQGYCLGYDLHSQRFGEYSDFGEWAAFDEGFDLAAYLARP